jgi:hypothetical protein
MKKSNSRQYQFCPLDYQLGEAHPLITSGVCTFFYLQAHI